MNLLFTVYINQYQFCLKYQESFPLLVIELTLPTTLMCICVHYTTMHCWNVQILFTLKMGVSCSKYDMHQRGSQHNYSYPLAHICFLVLRDFYNSLPKSINMFLIELQADICHERVTNTINSNAPPGHICYCIFNKLPLSIYFNLLLL